MAFAITAGAAPIAPITIAAPIKHFVFICISKFWLCTVFFLGVNFSLRKKNGSGSTT
jgi:hypothetical protein